MQGKSKANERILLKDQIAATSIQEDCIRGMIMKSKNQSYKLVKENNCPTSHQSPWGDFPVELTGKILNPKKTEIKGGIDPFSDITKSKTFAMPHESKLKPRSIGVPSLFREHYDRGVLPIKVLHSGSTNKILWLTEPNKVDLKLLMPIFIDGLREKIDPYRILAILGTFDLIERNSTPQIIEIVPLLIQPLKLALNSRDNDVMSTTCKTLIKFLTVHPTIGKHLVPYYRQLLPVFNLMRTNNKNLGDKIDYSQQKGLNVSEIMNQCLLLMEKTGGDDAFINIKYMIPTYESCVYI